MSSRDRIHEHIDEDGLEETVETLVPSQRDPIFQGPRLKYQRNEGEGEITIFDEREINEGNLGCWITADEDIAVDLEGN